VEPIQEHWVVAMHILIYLHGTIMYGLRYATNSEVKLHGFTDSYSAGTMEDRKSTSRLSFNLGFAMISWDIRKKKVYFTQNCISRVYCNL
jgi:hypothetical protein